MSTPETIRVHAQSRQLEIEWRDGTISILSHHLLRRQCPCAICRALRHTGEAVKVPFDIALEAVNVYGANAVQLTFDDGHNRGIFPFAFLRSLAADGAGAFDPVDNAVEASISP